MRTKTDAPSTSLKFDQCSVVIPVRNEASVLPRLMECLERQVVLPVEIIFVDDHSTDESLAIINQWAGVIKQISVVSLQPHLKGKKQAVHKGIECASSPYCLTLDADVWMENRFFESLSVRTDVDMQIRPVIMKGRSYWGIIAGIEYQLFNAFSYWIHPFYVLSASGANLLVKRSTYFEYGDFNSHKHITSGDDYFLLRNFQKNNAVISHSIEQGDKVYTRAPTGASDYFNQRVRWLRKSRTTSSMKELLLGLLIAFYLIGSFGFLLMSLIRGDCTGALVIYGLRLFTDVIVFLHYQRPLNDLSYWWLLPFVQLIYPLIFLSVAGVSIFYRPKWKSRKVEQ
ncbi:MAG: glycosyltransferase [Bacteroidota bacterium]